MKNLVNIGFGRDDLLRMSIGIIYCWFGALKFFPDLGPAEELAKTTISILTHGMVSGALAYLLLAIIEFSIGVFLIVNLFSRTTIFLALAHMGGTFMPLLLMQDAAFGESPLSLTLSGQYIIKNIVIVSALISIFPIKKSYPIGSKLKSLGSFLERIFTQPTEGQSGCGSTTNYRLGP